jgi:restriction system protein
VDRDPQSPWNPRLPAEISPTDFEKLVLGWLQGATGGGLERVEATHGALVTGDGGSYAIDVLVTLSVLGGAEVVVLVECKHKGRPVERDAVLVLESKLRDVGAHKGMLFSTSGFQSGAVEYATARGIATVTVVEGKWLFETRDAGLGPAEPPPWAHDDKYAGIRLTAHDKSMSSHAIDSDGVDAIVEWLAEGEQ